jgi:hypothetical protein
VLSGEVLPLAAASPKLSDGNSVDVSAVRAVPAAALTGRAGASAAPAAAKRFGVKAAPPTNDELAAELTAAAAELGGAVLLLGAEIAAKAARVVGSPDAKQAAGSAGAAVGGLGAALAAASAAWDRAMEETVAKNVGKGNGAMGQSASDGGEWWVKAAWAQMLTDPEVAKALKLSTDAAADAAAGLGAVGSAVVAGGGEATDSGVLAALQASIVRLAKVTTAVASRVSGSESNFILPPGK